MGMNLKKKVRARMALTGESWQTALRGVRQTSPLPESKKDLCSNPHQPNSQESPSKPGQIP